MGTSLADRASRRAGMVYEPAIREALADGNSHAALNLALRSLQSEMAKLRRRRPADGSLTDAELAGSIASIAAGLHAYKPRKPPGCPKVPEPHNLLSVYEASLAQAGDGSQS